MHTHVCLHLYFELRAVSQRIYSHIHIYAIEIHLNFINIQFWYMVTYNVTITCATSSSCAQKTDVDNNGTTIRRRWQSSIFENHYLKKKPFENNKLKKNKL